MNLHKLSGIALYNNAAALSVVVGKLMGGALGMALMDPIHRYAGVTPHLTVGPSLALRHATRADGAAWGPGLALDELDGAAPFVWREGDVSCPPRLPQLLTNFWTRAPPPSAP